ncbi:MAG: SMP-30/gluconolactonase/LRE family protein [Actinomycetota bacterium]
MTTTRLLRSGLRFGEGPRWHDGRLWYSDFYDHAVHAIGLDGDDERVVEVPGQPSGLGWLPDGSLLVSSMTDRQVLRWDGTALHPHADLSAHAGWWVNDLVVDATGRAFVGNFGFDLDAFLDEHGIDGVLGEPGPPATVLCRVDPDGAVSVAATDMRFPNGSVIAPDGTTLIVAETLALRLSAFDIAGDGALTNRRVWADLSPVLGAPDGICLDADGAVWIANATAPQCLRVAEGGEILDTVDTTQTAFACMLGGPEGRHLFVMTAPDSNHTARAAATDGRIEVAEVGVPHAGLP